MKYSPDCDVGALEARNRNTDLSRETREGWFAQTDWLCLALPRRAVPCGRIDGKHIVIEPDDCQYVRPRRGDTTAFDGTPPVRAYVDVPIWIGWEAATCREVRRRGAFWSVDSPIYGVSPVATRPISHGPYVASAHDCDAREEFGQG